MSIYYRTCSWNLQEEKEKSLHSSSREFSSIYLDPSSPWESVSEKKIEAMVARGSQAGLLYF